METLGGGFRFRPLRRRQNRRMIAIEIRLQAAGENGRDLLPLDGQNPFDHDFF